MSTQQMTHLHGVHFMLGERAVNWTATEYSRFGSVMRSKSCSSSLMTPSGEAAARVVNLSVVDSAATMQSGTAATADSKYFSNIVDGEQGKRERFVGYVSRSTRSALAMAPRLCPLTARDDLHDTLPSHVFAFMSHALLLRLFLSPSFFSVNVALQYLTLYHNNIGITYYLTRRLREFDGNELRNVWGFIW